MIEALATGLYFACVDFMIHTANLLGLTYRDTNALMFFVVWPAVTAALSALVLWQAAALRRPRSAPRQPPLSRSEPERPASPSAP